MEGSFRNGDIPTSFKFTDGDEVVNANNLTLNGSAFEPNPPANDASGYVESFYGDALFDDWNTDNDVLNLKLAAGNAAGAAIVQNIETVNISVGATTTTGVAPTVGSGVVDFANFSGLQTVNVAGTTEAAIVLANIADTGATTVDAPGLLGKKSSLFADFGASTDKAALTITGGEGADVLRGAGANDTISGGAGADVIIGNAGNDALSGGLGGDLVNGGVGNDTIDGGEGDDVLGAVDSEGVIPDSFADALAALGLDGEGKLAEAGNDKINGGAGDDIINGGTGDDIINGGTGADEMSGGIGENLFVLATGDTVAATGTTLTSGGDPDTVVVFGKGADVITDFGNTLSASPTNFIEMDGVRYGNDLQAQFDNNEVGLATVEDGNYVFNFDGIEPNSDGVYTFVVDGAISTEGGVTTFVTSDGTATDVLLFQVTMADATAGETEGTSVVSVKAVETLLLDGVWA